VVLANPPFGQKSASTGSRGREGSQGRGVYSGREFWVQTKNKQLNFMQHIAQLMKINGRAAVVLPDNVLFEGGAGRNDTAQAAERVRPAHAAPLAYRDFYAGGVKANVLFFERKRPSENRGRPGCGYTTSGPGRTSPSAASAPTRAPAALRRLLLPARSPERVETECFNPSHTTSDRPRQVNLTSPG